MQNTGKEGIHLDNPIPLHHVDEPPTFFRVLGFALLSGVGGVAAGALWMLGNPEWAIPVAVGDTILTGLGLYLSHNR